MQMDKPTWTEVWGPAIKKLTTGKELLGPKNNAMGKHLEKLPKMKELAAAFVATLLNEKQEAMEAQRVLDEMRKLLPVLGKDGQPMPLPASKFPTATYRTLLEFISAKMLWQAGHDWALPGTNKGGNDLQADYDVAGGKEVGDHLTVHTPKTVDELVNGICGGISFKVAKYPLVRVVIHVTDSPVYPKVEDLGFEGWQKLLIGPIAKMKEEVTKGLSLLAIIAGRNAYQFSRKDLGL